MKRATLALLVLPFVALWLYGCDQTQNPLEAATAEDSEQALFAAGGKVKAQPNPIGCTQDQIAKWDETSGAWVCAADLQGATGPQPALLSGFELVRHVVQGHNHIIATARCPAGKKPITGGYSSSGKDLSIMRNRPTEDGWEASLYNDKYADGAEVIAWALCVDAMPTP